MTIQVFITPLEPLAYFTCDEVEDDAPLLVRCHDESENASGVRWDFGDGRGGDPVSVAGATTEHVYEAGGPYTIRLTAVGAGHDFYEREIWVHGPRRPGFTPFRVSLRAHTAEAVERTVKEIAVDEIKDDHRRWRRSVEIRALEFAADDGFVIVDYEFDETAVNHFADRGYALADDGSKLVWNVELSCGPQLDSWRGWVRGTMTLIQERRIESQAVWLAEGLELSSEGVVRLASALLLDTVREIEVVDEAGAVLASARPGQRLEIDSRGLGLDLEQHEGSLALKVERLESRQARRSPIRESSPRLAAR